ncbi:steroid 21-hydroxylase-like isoform X6 [Prinia subflava]|uniref:steroid 21-hydroxylase-like isoform X6 n=1 Tax=Prinia subflava TaxID=208062 RepID=UPI002FE17F1F
MAAVALLLCLLLLLPPLAALLRRRDGRGPRCGALHLLHPQGALHLSRLARRHGPVLRLRLGGRDVLVPSSVGTIREALVRHWGDWLGRPSSYLGSLVSQGGRDLALGGPCPGWRRQRGAVRRALAQAGGRLGPLLWLQGRELCEELHSHGGVPLDPFEVFTFHTCSTIARLLFGDLVPPPGELRAFSHCLGELLQVWGCSSVQVLDLLPLLRAVPNPGLRKLLRLVQRRDTFVEAQIQRHQLQAQLRAELEGAQGPPGPGDMGRLPLLQATVNETLRLRPPAPLALPHCALRHTSLGGLPVVAGTVLVPNLLAAQQDPDIWQHPEVFLPGMWVHLHSESPHAELLGSPQTSNWVPPTVGSPLTPGYPGNTLVSTPKPESPKPTPPPPNLWFSPPSPFIPPCIWVPPKTCGPLCSSPLFPPPPQTPETLLGCLYPENTFPNM